MMVDPSSVKELKKGEWRTLIAVAFIGLLTALVSTVLPWLLPTRGDVANANPTSKFIGTDVAKMTTSWPNLTHGS